MQPDEAPRILIVGTGAIGSLYAYFFTKAGCQVTCICRSNFEEVSQNGIKIESDILGNQTCRLHQVVKSSEDLHGIQYDYILITIKAFPGKNGDLIQGLKGLVGSKTSIVLVQNGIDIEQEYHLAFPATTIISGVVYLPCSQIRAGVVRQNGPDVLEVGCFPTISKATDTGRAQQAETLQTILRAGGANISVFNDIQQRRWKKSLINACWNPISSLTRCTDTQFIQSNDQAFELCRSVMLEVLSIARALGYETLTEHDVDVQMDRATQRAKTGKGIKMSMLVDVELGRPMEVEAIIGNVVRKGRDINVKTPKLDMLYLLALALNKQQ